MKQKALGGILFILGALVMLSPRYILPVCEFAGKPRMACTYTANAELFIGFVLLFIAVGAFFSKSPDALMWLMFAAFASGVSVVFIPDVLGYCVNPQMPCYYGSVPLLRLLGIAVSTASAIGFFMSGKVKRTT